ncbi:MAG: alkaline phosphatase D family protein, partial [Flavobacteriales bacterium]
GYVDMREARIWLGNDYYTQAKIHYREAENTSAKVSIVPITLNENNRYTATAILSPLKPGTSYRYWVEANNPSGATVLFGDTSSFTTQPLWQFRSEPPNFTLATGSCSFINVPELDRPGDPFGGEYAIYNAIASRKPNLMVWLGDNIYLREADYHCETCIDERYLHSRSLPEMQSLLHNAANVAIWDDHDFGPNDADGSYIHKDWTLNAFKRFWANPSYGIPGSDAAEGITSYLPFHDVGVFLLDNRYHRTSPDTLDTTLPTILGESQLQWLFQSLKKSKASFKIIALGGQFLNTETYPENYSTYPIERQRILNFIDQEHIENVIFLTGDRHCGELSAVQLPSGIAVYDLTVSPLTSRSFDISKEKNTTRVEGTLINKRHFATIEFSGPIKERQAKIRVFDSQGVEQYTKTIQREKQ